MANMRDVAERSGVSLAGVSRILSGDPSFNTKESTKRRVLEAARELKYSVPERTRAKTKKLGCILSYTAKQFSDEYFMTILASINRFLSDTDCTITSLFSREEISGEKLDGLAGLFVFDDSLENIDMLKHRVPCVVGVDTDYPETDNVGHDYYRTGLHAVERLLSRGHMHIAYIGGAESTLLGRERSYMDALSQHGIEIPESYVMDCGWEPERCFKMVTELLKREDRPTAVFAGSDNLAIAVMSAAQTLGLSIPGDVAVVGVNNLEFTAFTSPPLTTVSIPMEEIGTAASELMLRRLVGYSGMPMKILLPTRLVARDSG